jgi:hypothetical protein
MLVVPVKVTIDPSAPKMPSLGPGRPARSRVTRLPDKPWQNCVSAGVNRTVAPETHLRKNRTFRAVK